MNKLIKIKKIYTPETGSLSFFEAKKDIPFEIKRIYYTYDVPVDIKRGMHAHKDLDQVLWCPYGIIEVVLDNGENKKTYLLDSPNKLLLIGSGIWREVYWKKKGSVLCVAASDYYNEDDYIRNYDTFLNYVKEGYWKDENKL
ncbi:sugar 3,4-ketoisomerase [Clostridium algidicarnis]|uniref:sugar 3,4-ketoisomerase n=1 Tax=Clostridium algidicarnis TaxID=37659 RepID=UPI003FD80F34